MTEVLEREVTITKLSNWTDSRTGKKYRVGITFMTNDGLEIQANNMDCTKEEFDRLQSAYDRDAKLTLRATLK